MALRSVDWFKLYRDVDELQTNNSVPVLPSYSRGNRFSTLTKDESYPLPFEIERQLADDLAFLAANEAAAHKVSAATIDLDVVAGNATVRLAANEGKGTSVQECFTAILYLLERCAALGTCCWRCVLPQH